MENQLGTGLRHNKGKLRYDLVNPFAHEQMVKVLTMGAEKYAERNWEKGMKWSNVISSLKRHIEAIERGEDYDPESGLLHAAHAAANIHFLTGYYKLYPQGDDRPKKIYRPIKYGLDIDGVLADFVTHLMNCTGNQGHVPLHWNDPITRNNFGKIASDNEFWSSIPPLLSRAEIPFEPHAYITARSIPQEITQQWLDSNLFPKAKLYCVGNGESKVEVAKASGIDIMIDDSYSNFIELNANGVFCYLYDAPYNRQYDVGHMRIKSLMDLA